MNGITGALRQASLLVVVGTRRGAAQLPALVRFGKVSRRGVTERLRQAFSQTETCEALSLAYG